jgi:mono/diheme cytochrome c family protein
MPPRLPGVCFVIALCAGTCAGVSAADAVAPQEVDYDRDIKPVLTQRCYECHGPETRESGLRLDRKSDALNGGDSGKVILPGNSKESLLIRYVSGEDPETIMPPDGERLTDEQVSLLKRWIDGGVAWPDSKEEGRRSGGDHWAYQAVVRREPPEVRNREWLGNEVDAFVLAGLAARGIGPSPEADRFTLIKRLYYDLLGLPPEPEAVDRFVHDASGDAWERLVDELLRSPHFGERWGRHWLDLARYADSDGYEKDNPRYNAWKYRDWVIRAINEDLPFDQFTIEQLAGDLLPESSAEQLLATAFNRQTLTNTEGGTDQEEFRVAAVMDRTETLGAAWLGLTVGCARCHTHKYDQITQREYYQFFAFFNNGDETTATMATSIEALREYQAAKVEFAAKLLELQQPLEETKRALAPRLAEWEAAQQARIAALAASPPVFHPLVVTRVLSEQGATLESQADGSYLATGERPLQDVYVLEGTVDAPALTALKLEVLAHDALPGKGPGRADHGNFVLSEITAAVTGNDGGPLALKFSRARADFAQQQFDPAQAIDRKEDATGWAIANEMGKDHQATFYLSEESRAQLAVRSGALPLSIRLSQQYSASPHTIGRFRITAMTGEDPESLGLSENVRKVLAIDPERRDDKQRSELLDYFAGLDPEVKSLQAKVDEFRKKEPFNPEMTVPIIRERANDRRTTRLLKRGDFQQPVDEVEPAALGTLHVLASRNEGRAADRLDLARWLTSPENPLTPRVAANQVWQHLFGRGLVKTVNDFGVRGEPPSHPELLDWLASEYVRLGWSRKALIKTIVMSHTYRQSSQHRPELAEIDAENVLLHRQNRFRVEAEIVRDLHLAASGLLERRIGGPSVFPPLPPGIAELSYANNFKWGNSDWNTRPDRPGGIAPKDDVYRRGMYTFFKRTAPHPNLTTFDCPDGVLATIERSASNTPLQALVTLNNETFVESARTMARRVLAEVNTNDAERVTRMLRLCVARPPAAGEVSRFLDLLDAARAYYREHADEAQSFAKETLPAETTAAEAAAWTATARVVMNVDEFITRE